MILLGHFYPTYKKNFVLNPLVATEIANSKLNHRSAIKFLPSEVNG